MELDFAKLGGLVPARIPMGMPVNTRDPSDPMGGNHWAGKRFVAPLTEIDPAGSVMFTARLSPSKPVRRGLT